MMDHGRFAYSPIVDRTPKALPGNARVGLWISPNVEHFPWKQPGMAMTPMTAALSPDVLNYAWRDYGARVGIWRLMDVLAKHGVAVTAALNSDVCDHYPQIVEAGTKAGWEWMAHGPNNSMVFTGMGPDDERPLINAVIDRIEQATGIRPRGWLGPALTETDNTLDILAQAGIDYVCDWANDELPYEILTASGDIAALPYTLEIGDIPIFLQHGGTGDDFQRILIDHFDQLYEEGEHSPRIMSIAVHPFLIGHPFRARALDRALAHICGHEGVWMATGSEMVDWFRAPG
ncbi:polysaccharide deacetylase family protein [Sphingorhabdus sp.]|jgi:allantoinase|uniref:polysaccharide deacetylase family protein n=1 Tax=Sphingorhabdus sp. TaxID=1902408 RepID=UPI0037C9DB2D